MWPERETEVWGPLLSSTFFSKSTGVTLFVTVSRVVFLQFWCWDEETLKNDLKLFCLPEASVNHISKGLIIYRNGKREVMM